MKMKKYMFLLFFIILFTGCNSKSEFVQKNAFNNDTIFCNNYAFSLDEKNDLSNGDFSLYEFVENKGYKKIGNIIDGDFEGKIIESNQYFIFINEVNPYISIYQKDSLQNVSKTGIKDVSYISDVFGIEDNYLYLSYVSSNGVYYLKYDVNTLNLENVSASNIPMIFDYQVCN